MIKVRGHNLLMGCHIAITALFFWPISLREFISFICWLVALQPFKLKNARSWPPDMLYDIGTSFNARLCVVINKVRRKLRASKKKRHGKFLRYNLLSLTHLCVKSKRAPESISDLGFIQKRPSPRFLSFCLLCLCCLCVSQNNHTFLTGS